MGSAVLYPYYPWWIPKSRKKKKVLQRISKVKLGLTPPRCVGPSLSMVKMKSECFALDISFKLQAGIDSAALRRTQPIHGENEKQMLRIGYFIQTPSWDWLRCAASDPANPWWKWKANHLRCFFFTVQASFKQAWAAALENKKAFLRRPCFSFICDPAGIQTVVLKNWLSNPYDARNFY